MGVLRALTGAVVLLDLMTGAPAIAQISTAADAAGYTVFAAGRLSMDQAVKMAEQRFKARVVRAETQRDGDRTVYVLRLLDDAGRVWTVRVDAESGSIQ